VAADSTKCETILPLPRLHGDGGKFDHEQQLVNRFLEHLRSNASPWGKMNAASEFFYQSGRTDVIAVGEDELIYAFEAKLKRWRDALHQAYRNTCFAHRSFVLLPYEVAEQALRYMQEFEKRGIGLCSVVEGGIMVLHESSGHVPLQPWLSEQAISRVTGVGDARSQTRGSSEGDL
jgi:hypothetical protein